ncbi:recombinase family protein [Parafrankia sp. BMG5.11]|uniref:recombinase family protein n=1 Tax=Parafrankia sp. BMG5.11 TaxID=222540 RepID=UPI00103BB7B8|nr:recombinase family protein [Parafrankia sp. BMG5.11]TCJ34572.1 recombinase family protein [Parafrankia sp. BMG5.11]
MTPPIRRATIAVADPTASIHRMGPREADVSHTPPATGEGTPPTGHPRSRRQPGRRMTTPSSGTLWGSTIPQPTVRVALSLRASTDEENQPYSLDGQEAGLKKFVASQPGWTIVKIYRDRKSGATMDRPGLLQAISDARAHRYDVLLVYRVDRIARSLRVLCQIVDELDKTGVTFRSATEPFDTSTHIGRMLMQILGMFAEFERAAMIDRIRKALRAKSAKGGWHAGRTPYGYTVDENKLFLVPVPDQALVIEEIFHLYTRRHLGSKAIANHLNEKGLRTRDGGLWSDRYITTLLRNRVYTGEIYYDDSWHPAPHTPLVDSDTFAKATKILDARSRDHSLRASNPAEYELTGRIVCDRCNAAYTGALAHGRSREYRYYICHNRQRFGKNRCDNDRLPADALEDAVINALIKAYSTSTIFDAAIAAHQTRTAEPQQDHSEHLARLENQINSIRGKIRKYQTAFEEGTMPEDACGERIRDLATQLTQVQDEHDKIKIEMVEEPPDPVPLAKIGDVQGLILTLLTEAPAKEGSKPLRRAVLHTLTEEIRVRSRSDITPTFRIPDQDAVRVVPDPVGRGGVEPPTFRFSGLSA